MSKSRPDKQVLYHREYRLNYRAPCKPLYPVRDTHPKRLLQRHNSRRLVRLQGDGNYDAVKAFLDEYLLLDKEAYAVLDNLDDIPYDIRPIYPDGIQL